MIPFSLGEWLLADMQQSVSKAAPGALHRYRSVYEGIRKAILSRRMSAGIRLPSSRALAEELGVSRNTVVAAFDQLLAEGYVTAFASRTGAFRAWPANRCRSGREHARNSTICSRDG